MPPESMSRLQQGLWLFAFADALFLTGLFGAELVKCSGNVFYALMVVLIAAVMLFFSLEALIPVLVVIALFVLVEPLKTPQRRRRWLLAIAPLLLVSGLTGAYVASHDPYPRCGAFDGGR